MASQAFCPARAKGAIKAISIKSFFIVMESNRFIHIPVYLRYEPPEPDREAPLFPPVLLLEAPELIELPMLLLLEVPELTELLLLVAEEEELLLYEEPLS